MPYGWGHAFAFVVQCLIHVLSRLVLRKTLESDNQVQFTTAMGPSIHCEARRCSHIPLAQGPLWNWRGIRMWFIGLLRVAKWEAQHQNDACNATLTH
jgi:hypothetical protein